MSDDKFHEFQSWVGPYTVPTKRWIINRLNEWDADSITELGCGAGEIYEGIKIAELNVDYTGVDSCEYLLKIAKAKGASVVESDIMEYVGHHTDVVYSRHVLEHLDDFSSVEKCFDVVAVIKPKWFVNVFFAPPGDVEQLKRLQEYQGLAQNTYSAHKITDAIVSRFPDATINWIPIGGEMVMEVKTNAAD